MGTFVQDRGLWDDSGNPAASIARAFSSNVTSGNLIYVAVNLVGTDQTPTCSDSLGNTYTFIAKDWDAGEEYGIAHWWAISGSSGACTVTVSFSPNNGSNTKIYIHEASGIAAASPLGGNAQDAKFHNSTATDGVTSGAFLPSADNCYIIGAYIPTGGLTVSAGTGFTIGYNTLRVHGERLQQTTAASVAATFTQSATSIGGCAGAAFKETGGGATIDPGIITGSAIVLGNPFISLR